MRGLPLLAAATALAAAPAAPITPRFAADPSPHLFAGKVYLYATDDASNSGKYWDSTSWRLYTSRDMAHWTDAGSPLASNVFRWAKPDAKAWAPEAAYRDGKYVFYAPVGGDRIGVAVAARPEGPFRDARQDALIDKARDANTGAEPIDPAVLIDADGQAYLFFGTRTPKVVRLKRNMVETEGPILDVVVNGLPTAPKKVAYGEAPFIHKRGGLYYYSFSTGWPGQIVYATSTSPVGPFAYRGVVLDYRKISTNHHAILERQGKWWLFYHDNLLPGGGGYRRAITLAPLTYAPDGSIIEVKAPPPS